MCSQEKVKMTPLYLLCCGLLTQSAVNANNLEATIIRDLLDGYNPRAFPLDDDEPISVNVSYFLNQVQGLEWFDNNLAKNNVQMKRSFVILEPTDIWKPKILVSNSVHETEDITTRKSSTVKLYVRNGRVMLNTLGKDTTFCPMNLRYFPFDKHTCDISFFQVPRYGINLSSENQNHYEKEGIVFGKAPVPIDQVFFPENGEWEVVSLKLDTDPRVLEYKGSIITYPIFTVTLQLQRKPSFYVMILLVPSILVSLISVIGFLLPSESGEKISLQLTALLSYSLVFLVIVDIIPPIGGNFPLIAQLLVASQISTTCNLILTVIFLRLFHHEPSPVPRKLRHAVFKIVAPMIFFDVKVEENNISKVVPNEPTLKENGQKTVEVDSTLKQELEADGDEMHIKE